MKHRLYAMTYCDPLVDEGSRRCFELNVHICVGCSVRGGGAMCASSEDGVTALGRLQPAQLGRQDEVICDVCPAVRTVVCGVENEVNFFCGECIQKKAHGKINAKIQKSLNSLRQSIPNNGNH